MLPVRFEFLIYVSLQLYNCASSLLADLTICCFDFVCRSLQVDLFPSCLLARSFHVHVVTSMRSFVIQVIVKISSRSHGYNQLNLHRFCMGYNHIELTRAATTGESSWATSTWRAHGPQHHVYLSLNHTGYTPRVVGHQPSDELSCLPTT